MRDVQATVDEMKKNLVDAREYVASFLVTYKMRGITTSRMGDINITDPFDGESIRSMARLRAKVGEAVALGRWPVRQPSSHTASTRTVRARVPPLRLRTPSPPPAACVATRAIRAPSVQQPVQGAAG